MTDRSIIKQKRISRKYKFLNDDIEYLQMQHLKDKADFHERIHTMHADQIIMENLLLSMEEQVYFRIQAGVSEEEEEKRVEMEFVRNQSCCNLAFGNYNEWAIHMDNHNVESKNEEEECVPSAGNRIRTYKCEIPNCNKSYTSAYGLRYHLEKGHRGEEDSSKPFGCVVEGCKRRYKNANGLKYHMQHGHGD